MKTAEGRSLRGNVDRNKEGVKTRIRFLQSFPTWERGQKYRQYNMVPEFVRSFPTWERGQKYNSGDYSDCSSVRRSLRGNVDRNSFKKLSEKGHPVVPYVGTWIEIPTVL